MNMTRKLFGLLWLLSAGSAERFADSGVECAIFSWIDGQRDQDNRIVFEEYYEAWTSCDKNRDSYLSKDEVVSAIEQLQAGKNSYLELEFGDTSFYVLHKRFKMIDKNSDSIISLSEFELFYKETVAWIDQMDRTMENSRKSLNIFS